ncbi:hypothetical protein LSH36_15g20105, partial [Paralvinella palmiformis]
TSTTNQPNTSIQKKGDCNYHLHSTFSIIHPNIKRVLIKIARHVKPVFDE